MYIHGEFVTQLGEVVGVHILTNNDRSEVVEVAPDSERVQFPADNPVEINSETNDTFDVLLPQSATIKLLTRGYIPELFSVSARNVVVNIYKAGVCIFAGYVEPQTYSQPYNELWDELELNCIDALSALQYSKPGGGKWAKAWATLDGKSFGGFLFDALDSVRKGLKIVNSDPQRVAVWYDCSKGLTDVWGYIERAKLLESVRVSPAIFLGEEDDDVDTHKDIIEEVLRYLNLHIRQVGFEFFIFSWESVQERAGRRWVDISPELTTGHVVKDTTHKVVGISSDNVADTNTSISIGEVYNKISVTADVEELSDLIDQPLDEKDLTAAHEGRPLYMTEYRVEGNDRKAFSELMSKGETSTDKATITDWYVRTMTHKKWRFYDGQGSELTGETADPTAVRSDWWEEFSRIMAEVGLAEAEGVAKVPNLLAKGISSAILSVGSVERKANKQDNSLTAKIDFSNVLVVGVNGNGYDDATATGERKALPDEAEIKASIPVAQYTGNIGGVLSPADSKTTNYIVISGKILLNARKYAGKDLAQRAYTKPAKKFLQGGYFSDPAAYGMSSEDAIYKRWGDGFSPNTGKGDKVFEFKYSAIGDNTDTVSKIAVLACMLIVGDKCVVESGTQGQITDFEWRKYKTRQECASEDEYYSQCFTIGFNPKIGDYLVGQEYDVQNNIHFSYDIEAEGTAIPIRESDRVSGQVKFVILGPVNSVFDDITRRHPTFFRHTKWRSSSKLILPHVSNIQIKDFGIKVVSDSGGLTTTNGKDIVYTSDTSELFDNPKDDIEFKITTALTYDECKKLGILNKINVSTPMVISSGSALKGLYDNNKQATAKPEQLYVDSYYKECSTPRITMEQSLIDTPEVVGLFYHYTHPALGGKKFYVVGISRNLIEGVARLTIKEA